MKGFGVSISDIMRCPKRQMDVAHYGLDGVCRCFEEFTHMPAPILRHFTYDHLPEHLQAVSKPFCDLAHQLDQDIAPSAELSTALRKLLEGKDAAVRAKIEQVAGS